MGNPVSRFGHDLSRIPLHAKEPGIQPKLKIGAPGDLFEQEADRVADQVLRMGGERNTPPAPVAQTTQGPVIQRAINFGAGTENLQHRVVDPLTGKERQSERLDIEFEVGMEKFLALRPQWSFGSIIGAEELPKREAQIRAEFAKRFPVEVVQTGPSPDSAELYRDVRKTIKTEKAIEIWEEVREDVKDQIESLLSDAKIRKRKKSELDLAVRADSEYLANDIVIDPEQFKNIAVSEAAHASFDGFWILLHEMRHLEGDKDAELGAPVLDNSSKDSVIRKERPRNLSGVHQKDAKVSLVGQVESKLNILRIGFGLPIRTNYSDDDGLITFSADAAAGAEEFYGASITGREAPLITSQECDPLADECPTGTACHPAADGFRCLPGS